MLAIISAITMPKEYSISFNASYIPGYIPGNRRWLSDFVRKCTFYVGDNPIEYVDSFVHLGHVITNQFVDNDNIIKRRNEFVGQINNVL
jgi:hypothetical protein